MNILLKLIPYIICTFLTSFLIYIDYVILFPMRMSNDTEKVLISLVWLCVEIALVCGVFLGSLLFQERLHINFHYTKLKVDDFEPVIHEESPWDV